MILCDDVIPRSLYLIQVVSGIGFVIRNIFWICLSIVRLAVLIRLVIRVKLRIIKQCN